jgi:copper chaperone CopZ
METIKHRVITVKGMTCSGCELRVKDRLTQMEGVEGVQPNFQEKRVRVSYDLMKTNLKAIEGAIDDLGYSANPNFLARLWAGWIHSTEENERENLSAKPLPCCSHPDELLAKRRMVHSQ